MLLGQLVTTALLTCVVSGCTGLMESASANKLLTLSTCKKVEAYISAASEIFYDGSSPSEHFYMFAEDNSLPPSDHPSYHQGIDHWASSSSQRAMCVFEPGLAEDVASRSANTRRDADTFCGGGHATNPGFSSTLGVHISMTRFSDITYNSSARTATVGAGMVWDDVYAALAQHGVVVVGGRVSGVGVSGFTLGGGYSWLTEQYGLAIDNVKEYELVMPNGTIIAVTESSSPELFFGLKGGFNNFGYRDQIYPPDVPSIIGLGKVSGADHIPLINVFVMKGRAAHHGWYGIWSSCAATQDFLENNIDTKAAVIVNYNILAGSKVAFVILFYDGPEPPKGLFDDFMEIEAYQDGDVVPSIPYLSSNIQGGFKKLSSTNFGQHYATQSGLHPYSLSIALEPFMFLHKLDSATSSISRGAFSPPSARGTGVHPLLLYAGWEDPTMDEQMYDAVGTIMETLKEKLAVASAGEVDIPRSSGPGRR
ncbi:FAD-binding domain-containing protein [Melanogaster broomeanus]|nr:FAD-binding domain-containing protein [Melanogaster broomeanus]